MLKDKDYTDINRTIGTINSVADTQRIPLSTILAIIDFILIGIREIFFDKMGKPKNKLQLILSLPAIIKFVAEVVKRITGNIKPTTRVKALTNEEKAVKAIEDGVASEAERRRRLESSRIVNERLRDPNGKKGAKD